MHRDLVLLLLCTELKIAYQVLIYNIAQVQNLNILEPSCCQNFKGWDMVQCKSPNLACEGLSALPSITQTKQRMYIDVQNNSLFWEGHSIHPKRIWAIFHLYGLYILKINAWKTRMEWIIHKSYPAPYRSSSRTMDRSHNSEQQEHERIQLGWEQLETVS